MQDSVPVSVPWSELLSPKSVAFHALTRPHRVEDLLPPGLSRLDEVLNERGPVFADRAYRKRLCDAFEDTNRRLAAPESARRSVELLREPDTFLVVTGQQAGFLTGPMYTIYKVATAIALAHRLSTERDQVFLPCFWCASEDHDFEEVRSVTLLDREWTVRGFRMPDPMADESPIFGLPRATCSLGEVLGFLEEVLRPTEFTPRILEAVEETYRASQSLSEWMVRLLWNFFSDDGLLMMLPEDGFYQKEARVILAAEIEHPLRSVEAVQRAGAELASRGLESQVHKVEGRSSFFLVRRDGDRFRRTTVFFEDGTFSNDEGEISAKDLLRSLEEDPLSISAAATLRPVCQDAVLPTAVTVLGPGEVNYYAQIGEVYAIHGVPRPAFQLRLSGTLLPARLQRFMEETGLGFSDFTRDPQWLLREVVKRSDPRAVGDDLAGLRDHMKKTFSALCEEAKRVDPTIVSALEKDRKAIEKIVNQAEGLLTRRRAQREKTLGRRIQTVQSILFPQGELQERVVNILYFLNLYGMDVLSRVKSLATRNPGESHFLFPL